MIGPPGLITISTFYNAGWEGLTERGEEGFSGPKDKADTDGQPHPTMLYLSKGLHEINFGMNAVNNCC